VSLAVTTTPEAEKQISTIDEWWRTNRSASPDLFLSELLNAFEIVSDAPRIGRPYRRSPLPDTRRLLLRGTRYHVYYVATADCVNVVAVWHAERGALPPLA